MKACPRCGFQNSDDLVEVFLQLIEIPSEPEACWSWKGPLLKGDALTYGHLAWANPNGSSVSHGYRFSNETAHRLSYMIFRGEIPKGMLVCHSCDNGLCVNPEHLWIGTPKQNTQDRLRKGR